MGDSFNTDFGAIMGMVIFALLMFILVRVKKCSHLLKVEKSNGWETVGVYKTECECYDALDTCGHWSKYKIDKCVPFKEKEMEVLNKFYNQVNRILK
jgi:hypothetical protein